MGRPSWWGDFLHALVRDTPAFGTTREPPMLGPDGPAAGHTWEISVRCRGAHGTAGEPGRRDAGYWDEPVTVRIRAHNLRDALQWASRHPITVWFPDEED